LLTNYVSTTIIAYIRDKLNTSIGQISAVRGGIFNEAFR